MAVFLVDFENVRSDGLDGIENLDEKNTIYIFYSENANQITFTMHRLIIQAKACVRYLKARTGTKNALDFQLASYLGYIINGEDSNEYYIISKDKGFESVAKFWTDNGVDVRLAERISDMDRVEENPKIDEFIEKILSDKGEREFVAKCIKELSTKSGINNRIVKNYGTTRAGEIYKLIKPLIKNKKG